ncbi:MAG: pilus assembly protein PilM [Planctomycetes bacterium]|nr:pilus assembly protein PilM [Planctomycetota bacterium]
MAKQVATWGIDIGDSALKALRCVPNEDGSHITAVAFDYIEYPKLLSQPDADRNELVVEALKQFLSRNSVRGDRVVISVGGQAGLARFIKLPPVETSKIPDIVRYEARQQIPFPLEDVVWDFQQLSGGMATEGFALDSEVGLFAMKRDQVYKYLKPFDDVDVEVDVIQLTPEALYNYVVFDQLTNLPPPDEYDPDNPPDSIVVMSLGTESTDLVVTNGFRIWQRSVPVGGNHFTKALVKDLKMNFATAEHLKRNAAQAEDPKALFQAMRPVFNDLLSETQRSLTYFKNNIDRKAKISRILVLGNAIRLPGLQKFLAQNLGHELAKVESLRGLSGSGVIDQPAFRDNLPAFGVCYGLALQGLSKARFNTNLLPPEIIQFRKIRAKKPWVALAASLMLIGFGASFFMWSEALKAVSLDPPQGDQFSTFRKPMDNANSVINDAAKWQKEFEENRAAFVKTDEVGQSIVQNVMHRDTWMQLLRAVNLCLPRNAGERPKEEIKLRDEIKIDSFDCRFVPKLEEWYAAHHKPAVPAPGAPSMDGSQPGEQPPPDPNADPNAQQPVPTAPTDAGPTGPGWVIQITAHHYRNIRSEPATNQGANFLRRTLMKNLEQDTVPIPDSERKEGDPPRFPVKKLGITYPLLMGDAAIDWNYKLTIPQGDGGDHGAGGGGQAPPPKIVEQPRYDFKVQFCWQPFKPAESAAKPAPDAAAMNQ